MKRILQQITVILAIHSVFITNALANELSQYTATRVQRAHQLQQDEKITEAIEALQSVELSRAYDKAFVARMLGVFYWQNEQPKLAIEHLSRAVNSGLLIDSQAWVTRRMLADILLTQEQFSRALSHYYQLVKRLPESQTGEPLWLRIAQSHYQLSEWEKVLAALESYDLAHQRSDKNGDNNSDKALQSDEYQPLTIKLGAQIQLKRWQQAIPTLERLIVLQPNKVNWWRQLVSIQLRLKQDRAALDSLALAKLQGVALSQSDLTLLAQLYAKRGVPERAAKIINNLEAAKTDIKLLTQQATYWQAAKEWENAIEAWSLAAEIDVTYHWQVAQLLVQEGHYQRALTELDKVTDKDKQAKVALAKARAFYKLDKLESALINAKKADNIAPSSEAKSWMKYLSQLRDAKAPIRGAKPRQSS